MPASSFLVKYRELICTSYIRNILVVRFIYAGFFFIFFPMGGWAFLWGLDFATTITITTSTTITTSLHILLAFPTYIQPE